MGMWKRDGHERSPATWSLSIGDSHQRLVISPPQVLEECPWLVLGHEQGNEDNLRPSLRFTDSYFLGWTLFWELVCTSLEQE